MSRRRTSQSLPRMCPTFQATRVAIISGLSAIAYLELAPALARAEGSVAIDRGQGKTRVKRLPRRSDEGKAMRREAILLVEDSRSLREILTLFFSEAYEVRHAATGAEALAILHREPINAVVLDYRLPDRTGLEVLIEIKSARPRVPVIMMTGYGSESLCAAAFKLGVSDYFAKPFNAFDLVHSVRRIVSSTDGGDQESVSSQASGPALPPGCFGKYPDLWIQKAVKLIQQRYWGHVSLSELAREARMSKYRFSRRFKKVVGIRFRDYLIRVRLERAKALLSATEASITEVAQTVGFGDLPRFDKLFKRYTGVTPYNYRAQSRAPQYRTKSPARSY